MGKKVFPCLLEPTSSFFTHQENVQKNGSDRFHSIRFIFSYVKDYKNYFVQIILGLFVGSLIQLAFPFLTQSIVDVGIKNQDIGFVWLVLIGQVMLTFGHTTIDFIRRWLLLHISMRVCVLLVSDFFIKLLKLPMSFFDVKLMGDLMQRKKDHNRVNEFLTGQIPTVTFAVFSFLVLSVVLYIYNVVIFSVFLLGSLLYAFWLTLFLQKRRELDYELFEQQAINKTRPMNL